MAAGPTGLEKVAVVWPSAGSGSSYSDNRIRWKNVASTTGVQVDYSTNGTDWLMIGSYPASPSTLTHTINVLNAAIYYRVRDFIPASGWTSWSSTLSFTVWTSTDTETVTMTEAYAGSGSTGGSMTAASDTRAEAVTMTDSYNETVISKTNIAYFMGSATGVVYKYNSSYHGDYGTPINGRWESKEIDFDDMYPQFRGKWKTVDRVWLRYMDKDIVTVTVSLSIDNGATWTSVSRSLGTATGYVKEANFDFRMTGRFFKIRVEETSSDKDFQWSDLDVEFYPSGDHFSLS